MITEAQWTVYVQGRANGLNMTQAARMASIGISSAKRFESKQPDGVQYRTASRANREMPDPRAVSALPPEAQRALEDFGYFQERYLGRIGLPWQVDAANRIVELLKTPDKEYCVINVAPGAGKSSTFTYAIPLWLTCRDRAIRGLVGSATSKLASRYTSQIRRALEATAPILADDEDKQKGVAVDAVATISGDFGRMKPQDAEAWTKDAFIVEQFGGRAITSKEPTWTAVGRDQEFIGGRYDFCIWDDLVTSNRLRTLDAIEKDRDWWDTYAERRLEPGGLLILQGQRMGANDLYRYCLDVEVAEIEDGDDEDTEGVSLREDEGVQRKYHQIIYKAHYDELCKGKETHKWSAPAYPDGCLLSPRRITWREISGMMKNRPDTFAQVYQQEDVSPDATLVNPAWVAGTGGFPGCWDKERDRLEVPQGLSAPSYSIVSVDPSPTRYWAIEWWLYNEPSDQWFLIDLLRQGMDAPDFLDWNQNSHTYSGVMEDWQQMSRDLGIPISHWIVEQNGAQRFLLKYDHVLKWQAKNQVQIIPHDTYRNKTSEEFGVQMIAPKFKYGNIRLPGKVSRTPGVGKGRALAMKLVDEVTRYPQASTDDCVMACWFALFQMQYLHRANSTPVRQSRPSWLSGRTMSRAS